MVLALIDRATAAAHGHGVLAIVNDEFVCRRLVRRGQEVRLECDGHALPDFELYGDECFLDFDGVPGDLAAMGRELRAEVLA